MSRTARALRRLADRLDRSEPSGRTPRRRATDRPVDEWTDEDRAYALSLVERTSPLQPRYEPPTGWAGVDRRRPPAPEETP